MSNNLLALPVILACAFALGDGSGAAERMPTEKEKAQFSRNFARGCSEGKNIYKSIVLIGGNKEIHNRYCHCVGNYFVEHVRSISDFDASNKKSPFYGSKFNWAAREFCLRKTFPVDSRNYDKLVELMNTDLSKMPIPMLVSGAYGNTISVEVVSSFGVPSVKDGVPSADDEFKKFVRDLACGLLKDYELFDTHVNVGAHVGRSGPAFSFLANLRSCNFLP